MTIAKHTAAPRVRSAGSEAEQRLLICTPFTSLLEQLQEAASRNRNLQSAQRSVADMQDTQGAKWRQERRRTSRRQPC